MASFARNAGFLFPECRLFISGTVALFRRIMQKSHDAESGKNQTSDM